MKIWQLYFEKVDSAMRSARCFARELLSTFWETGAQTFRNLMVTEVGLDYKPTPCKVVIFVTLAVSLTTTARSLALQYLEFLWIHLKVWKENRSLVAESRTHFVTVLVHSVLQAVLLSGTPRWPRPNGLRRQKQSFTNVLSVIVPTGRRKHFFGAAQTKNKCWVS